MQGVEYSVKSGLHLQSWTILLRRMQNGLVCSWWILHRAVINVAAISFPSTPAFGQEPPLEDVVGMARPSSSKDLPLGFSNSFENAVYSGGWWVCVP